MTVAAQHESLERRHTNLKAEVRGASMTLSYLQKENALKLDRVQEQLAEINQRLLDFSDQIDGLDRRLLSLEEGQRNLEEGQRSILAALEEIKTFMREHTH